MFIGKFCSSILLQTNGSVEGSTDLNLDEPLSAFFSSGVPVVNLVLVLSFFWKMIYYHDLSIASPSSIIYLGCMVFSVLIHVVVMSNNQGEWRCMIVYLSTMLRMLAAAALLLFLDTIPSLVVWLLLLLVLILVAYFFRQTFCIGVTPGMNWGVHKDELKLPFDISAQVVSMAFGGLTGKVLGYTKAGRLDSGYTAVAVAPECFLFYGAVLGLLVVLLCTVPIRISLRTTRQQMAKVFIPRISYAGLVFLVLAGVMAAENILEQYITAVFLFIVVLVAVFFCCCGICYRPLSLPTINETIAVDIARNALREQDSKLHNVLSTGYFTPLFAALMATQSTYGIESGTVASMSWWFKGFVLLAVFSILSYAVRIVISSILISSGPIPCTKSSCEFLKKAWSYTTYITMVITILSAVLLIVLHSEEVRNIF